MGVDDRALLFFYNGLLVVGGSEVPDVFCWNISSGAFRTVIGGSLSIAASGVGGRSLRLLCV